MLLTKKRRVLAGGLLLFTLLGLLALCGMLQERRSQPAIAAPAANKVIVVDAGHGGFDAGASGSGLLEKEVNLEVATYLKEYIEQGGGIAMLTRDRDESTADPGTQGLEAKRSDLARRKELANDTQADIFVSIHMNKFPQEQYRGAQVFYSDSQPESGKRLGEEIQQALKDVLQDGNQRSAKKIDGRVLILKDTAVPSVIVECGFLSNPQEAELLKQSDYRRNLAWGIYMGILRYFNQEP